MSWYVYIVECRDKTLYTGITTNIERRVQEHNTSNKSGARSLRGKRPVKLVYIEKVQDQKEAQQKERVIKSWKKEYKLRLVKGEF